MIGRDFRPRLDLNKMEANVIMSQIRAQKQKKSIRIIQPILTPGKMNHGKRHFQHNLYKLTDITNCQKSNNEEERSLSKGKGKRILMHSASMNHLQSTRQKSQGKKKFDYRLLKQSKRNPLVSKRREIQIPKQHFGRKRLDYSPNNQQRESRNSPLNWNKNMF